MKYGCDKCNKVFNRLLLAKRQARTKPRTRPLAPAKPSLSVTTQPGPVPTRVTQSPTSTTPLMCVVSRGGWRWRWTRASTRGVATRANSVGGHYSRSMLNKFKCLFCKYVNGITDGHSQSSWMPESESESESKSVSLGSTLLASRIRHVVQLIFLNNLTEKRIRIRKRKRNIL